MMLCICATATFLCTRECHTELSLSRLMAKDKSGVVALGDTRVPTRVQIFSNSHTCRINNLFLFQKAYEASAKRCQIATEFS